MSTSDGGHAERWDAGEALRDLRLPQTAQSLDEAGDGLPCTAWCAPDSLCQGC